MADDHDDHAHRDADSAAANDPGRGAPQGTTDAGRHSAPVGLTVAANGLRLAPSATRIVSGFRQEWTYRIRDEEGTTVADFEETHDRSAHLILVRRDLTRFQHLHPSLAADGRWTTEFRLPDPGAYRAFVDVVAEGRPTTLGVDLLASGPAEYEAPPGSTREAAADGYDVVMTPRDAAVGEASTVEFEVRRDGDAVRLDPYLGALGHLVALRDGDLAYLHVHPEETSPEDGVVRFAVRFPTSDGYRLFLQAKPDGDLITVAFDVRPE